ncbi:glycosyltransferase family 4 protein [Salipiger sp. P9]|uniref:glycosyltransferase family 4 protein n=1 Tax=Salipiger pentaromativorans TaxID=2943193 RepID=UPI002157900F|nr:glycosyltransferase family 1 protein [Salipiger pentaromativorans]MCR8548746.1 glycosyltransferase family 4 protein [Salipiger pentaromativorans]
MDITTAEAPPRLLDLTRLVSRAGRPFTGIDRVEYAYLAQLLDTGPLYGLVRSSLGYLLLDRRGCAELKRRLDANDWPAPDRLSRLRGRDAARAGAETALRRVAVARCLPHWLPRMLRRRLPAGTHYLNTGHTNLTDRVVGALRRVPGMKIAVLLHDTIPLDYPAYQAAGIPERFRGFLLRTGRFADLVICNSRQTERDLRRHLGPLGLAPETVVAHLGVPVPVPSAAPEGPWSGRRYFVVLGTVEPRKNHALLLDIWEQEAPDADLLICGGRGWNNAGVFARLDRGIARVHELPGLDDHQVAALLRGSAGLLFPSHAEGYGLPPMEAAALGVPVLANDLPVLREVLGDIPVYANVSKRYLWADKIRRMAEDRRADPDSEMRSAEGAALPGWDVHFKTVLTLI